MNIGNYFPKNSLILGRPKTFVIITYYIILFLYITSNYWKKNKYSHVLVGFLLIIFIYNPNNDLEISFLDLGQGDGIFLETNEGNTYLFDGGSANVKQVGKYRIIPFLKSKGINEIDYAFISHFDKDHVSGIIEILEEMDNKNIEIETLVIASSYEEAEHGEDVLSDELCDELYLECIRLAKEKGVKRIYMKEGDFIKNGDLLIKCLHPIANRPYSSKNSNSLVLDVSYKKFNLLLTGDIEDEGENFLNGVLSSQKNLYFNEKLEYNILKVAHHGSKNSISEGFLKILLMCYNFDIINKNR